jgi:hypothetical protein
MNLLMRYVPLGLLTALLFVLLRKRTYGSSPWFFAYVVFGVGADVARLITRLASTSHPTVYYFTYWISEAGYDVLGIAVMYEVVQAVIGSLARRWTGKLMFLVLVACGIGLSLGRSHAVPTQFSHGLPFYILIGETTVRFVQVLVFASLVTFVPILGLRWRQHPFGVATGFGVYATVALLINVKLSDFGTRFKLLWGWTSLVAYSFAVLIWIWFFSVPQKIEIPSSEMSAPSPGELKRYKDALRRMR